MYQQVEYILEKEELKPLCDVYLSYDEKHGIQAIENTADDLPTIHESIPPRNVTLSTNATEPSVSSRVLNL